MSAVKVLTERQATTILGATAVGAVVVLGRSRRAYDSGRYVLDRIAQTALTGKGETLITAVDSGRPTMTVGELERLRGKNEPTRWATYLLLSGRGLKEGTFVRSDDLWTWYEANDCPEWPSAVQVVEALMAFVDRS